MMHPVEATILTYIGDGRQVLVKRKAIHFVKGIVSGLLGIVMHLLLPEPQCGTLNQLYTCWRRLLMPEIRVQVYHI